MEKLTRDEKKKLKVLEKRLGVRFWNRELLRRAFTHKSFANEKKWDAIYHNERLEFLGDAVLELVVSHTLMDRFPDSTEGELSKLRAAMVNEKTLSDLARKLELGQSLYLGKGEEMGQGREKNSLLANAYEALLGALYLDRGFKKAFKVVTEHMHDLLERMNEDGFYCDYKTKLQETAQNLFKVIPRYHLADETGPDHDKTFTVQLTLNGETYGVGKGKNKKEAEQLAAREALKAIAEGRKTEREVEA